MFCLNIKKVKKHLSVFLALFLSLAVSSSETFFSVIISSVTGDKFVDRYWGLFYIFINIISLVFILKAIDYFKFNFKYFKKVDFKDKIVQLNFYLLFIHFLLNVSHWLSNMKSLNSFSSMIATICFLMFMSTLFYLQSIREKYEKEEQIKQKEQEQLQLQKYTDEIVSLYNEIRGFRHDYGGMLASFQSAIHTGDIKEVERIYQEVLVNANLQLRSDKYTYFDLNNVEGMQFDVLRELGNIGAGNATTALSSMLNTKVDMNVPKVDLLSFEELHEIMGGAETIVVGILVTLDEDIDGMMMFMMKTKSAFGLVDILFGRPVGTTPEDAELDEMSLSALKELGNIISGAYISSLSSMTQLKINQSIPYLSIDMAGAILSVPAIEFGKLGDKALLIESQFMEDDNDVTGYFILTPTLDSYNKILTSLGL